MLLTEVESHGDKYDEAEPDVEGGGEVDDGNDNVDDGGEDVEDEVGEQAIDGGRSAIHDAQNLPSFPAQVPSQTQGVKVAEQTNLKEMILTTVFTLSQLFSYLDFSGGVLLDSDPQESPDDVEQTVARGSTALQELQRDKDDDEVPAKADLALESHRGQCIN